MEIDSGKFQATYRDENINLYCLQEYTRGKIRFMECDDIGEPVREIHPARGLLIELDFLPGNEFMAGLMNDFIKKHPSFKGV